MGAGLSDRIAGSIISVLPVSVLGSPQAERGSVRDGKNTILNENATPPAMLGRIE